MNKTLFVTVCLVLLLISVHGRKTSRSRSSSGRGSSRKTNSNPQPAPTSFSNPQASAPKPTLFGWQEKPAHNTQNYASRSSKTSNGQNHGYPSSQTGLSGNSPAKQPPSNQESIQRSVPQQTAQHAGTPVNNKPGHSYPSSNGLSGNSGSPGYPQGSGLSGSGGSNTGSGGTGYQGKGLSGGGAGYPQGSGVSGGAGYPQGGGLSGGAGYPQGSGLSGGAGYPQGSGLSGGPGYANSGGTGVGYSHGSGMTGGHQPPPYSGYRPGTYNNGNHAPPPYSGNGHNYGGYGSPGFHPSNTPQMPGYFGNYGNNGRGFGSVSRSGSALTGLGIGAGVGTILTGLALWNLARSTGHHRHTVIYDNRGQPVAVAPANGTDPVIDPILKDLVNCSLTISNDNSTEVLAIPCAIATSFSPEADVLENTPTDGKSDNTRCTVTILTKTGKEFMTTIPCSTLLNTAAENNVTEPALLNNDSDNLNVTITELPNDASEASIGPALPNEPSALKLTGDDKNDTDTKMLDLDCKSSLENGDVRDPINPCYAVTKNLTVLPVETTDAPKDTKR